jgi:hypothetical protein
MSTIENFPVLFDDTATAEGQGQPFTAWGGRAGKN